MADTLSRIHAGSGRHGLDITSKVGAGQVAGEMAVNERGDRQFPRRGRLCRKNGVGDMANDSAHPASVVAAPSIDQTLEGCICDRERSNRWSIVEAPVRKPIFDRTETTPP